MVTLTDIKQAARTTTDDKGEPVVQIPLPLWQEFVIQSEPSASQKERILSLLERWEHEPEDDMPDEWWDEFMESLAANRVRFPERDLDLGDE